MHGFAGGQVGSVGGDEDEAVCAGEGCEAVGALIAVDGDPEDAFFVGGDAAHVFAAAGGMGNLLGKDRGDG